MPGSARVRSGWARPGRAAAALGAAMLLAGFHGAALAQEAPWFLPYAQICSTANHPPSAVGLACQDRGEQPLLQVPGQVPEDAGACQTDLVFPGYNLRFSWPSAGAEAECLCLDETGAEPRWVTYLRMTARAGPEGRLDRTWLDLGAAGTCATNGAVAGSRG